MSFVSYAQNFEDVMLWRALKHIEQGFYIDVGAWSPDRDSVTRAFYERGWRGINIEPNSEFHQQLEASRPRDVNLKVAISDTEGSMTMNFLANTGLSTLDDSIAQQHQAAGWEATRREVAVKTLVAIWQQHVPDGQPVHFLKVDVEGFEAAVLRGNDWARHRPWVVVVEATLPMSQVESHAEWEPTLLDAGYKFAYADGLNRFYVAEEHADLLPAFEYPPNFFDEFVLASHQQSEARAQQAEARAHESDVRAAQAGEAIKTLSQQVGTQSQQLHEAAEKSQTLQQQLNEASAHAAADQARVEQLQPQLHRSEQRIAALERELTDTRSQADEKLTTLSQQLETQRQQREEAAEKVQTLQQQLNEASAHAAADQARVEQLQPQLERAEQRIDALARELTDTRSQAEEKLTALSQHAETQSQQLHEAAEKAQTLQQQLNEASARVAAEQVLVEQLTVQLSEKDQALEVKQSELEQLHAHSQWLQNEWDAAKAKIDELNHSSQHWWTVADGLNRELQSVYHSKSWRITWPLRKLMQLLKWLLRLPVRVVVGLVRLPKRTARWFLAKAIAFVLRREGLKQRARRWLYRHPRLEAHLRAFARARGLIYRAMPTPQNHAATEVGIIETSLKLHSPNNTKISQPVWTPSEKKLELNELMARIRNELDASKAEQSTIV